MHKLPNEGYLRLPQIIGDKTANPEIPPVIPVCKSTWWQGIKSGKFPKPIKLGHRVTVWRVADIRELIEKEFFGYETKIVKISKKKPSI
jgi:predicted DNA-binding transcriptional regulator AlpA